MRLLCTVGAKETYKIYKRDQLCRCREKFFFALAIVKIFFLFFFTVPGRQRLVGIDCVGYSKDFFIFYFFYFFTVPGRQRLVGIDCVGYSKDHGDRCSCYHAPPCVNNNFLGNYYLLCNHGDRCSCYHAPPCVNNNFLCE